MCISGARLASPDAELDYDGKGVGVVEVYDCGQTP
jgi:hypothetical protein